MAYRMFASIQDAALSRTTSDCSYSVLTDALPLGKGRCQKQVRRGECDLCWIMLRRREPETTRPLWQSGRGLSVCQPPQSWESLTALPMSGYPSLCSFLPDLGRKDHT